MNQTLSAPVGRPKEKASKLKRCAIYSRVSTDEQTRQDYNSLESQRDICRHAIAIKQHEGWVEGEHFSDGGYSGKNLERPALRDLLAAARAGTIEAVVVYKLDRLTRSIADFYSLWEVFKRHGIIFVSATQSFDTSDPAGNLMLNMLLSFGQFERELTSERVRHKSLERAKRGLWNGGWVPTGYDYDKDTKILTPDDEEAPLIKRIFRLTEQLGSPAAVADNLNELGLTTKTRKITRRSGEEEEVGGKRWIGDRVTRIVTNPIYRGIILHGEVEYEGKHEALVGQRLWKSANLALVQNGSESRPHDDRNKYQLLLKGRLHCGHCGNLMTPKPSGKKDPTGNPYVYYSCGDVTKDGSASPCELRNISSKPFEEFVINVLTEFGKHPKAIAETVAQSKAEGKKSLRPSKAKAAELEKRYVDCCEELKRCVQFAAKHGAQKLGSAFEEEAEALAAQKEQLELEREIVKMNILRREQLIVQDEQISSALLEFGNVFDALRFQEQRDLFRLLVGKITLSRFDPETEKCECDPSVFKMKLRTSWYRVAFQLHLNPLIEGMPGQCGTGSHLGKDGGQGGIRTHGTR